MAAEQSRGLRIASIVLGVVILMLAVTGIVLMILDVPNRWPILVIALGGMIGGFTVLILMGIVERRRYNATKQNENASDT